MSLLFHRRLRRLESPGGVLSDLARILEEGRRRMVTDPEGAARDADARFEALVARAPDAGLCELEQLMLEGHRRVRAAAAGITGPTIER